MNNKEELKKQVIILSFILILVIIVAIILNFGKDKNIINKIERREIKWVRKLRQMQFVF